MPTTRPEVEAMNPLRYVRSTGIVDGRWHIVQCWIAKPWAPNPGARRWEWQPVRWWHPGDVTVTRSGVSSDMWDRIVELVR